MRGSVAIAAMVVRAPMRAAPSAPQPIPMVSGAAEISISGPRETPLRRRSERSVPAARNSGSRCVMDAEVMPRVLPFSAAISRSGRIGSSVSRMPVALQMALAMAGEVGTVATSPMPTLPPSTWSNPPSSKCTSIGGVSEMPGMR